MPSALCVGFRILQNLLNYSANIVIIQEFCLLLPVDLRIIVKHKSQGIVSLGILLKSELNRSAAHTTGSADGRKECCECGY